MKFTGKAETLLNLRKSFSNSIPFMMIFSANDFFKNENFVLKKINKKFTSKVAVRSTYLDEDTSTKSNAGKYKTFLNLKKNDTFNLKKSILSVIRSYKSKRKVKFFVQEMVQDVKISGVCLTKSLNSIFPALEINFSESQKTDIVTSGKSNVKNLIYVQNKKFKVKDKKFLKLIKFVSNLKKKFKNDSLNIEFAIDKKNKLHILQVRPIVGKKKHLSYNETNLILDKISKKINKLQTPHHNLFGTTTYFGVMPDWNPAEIIGVKPNPLALSLYQELITNNVWSKNRLKCGFQDVNSSHLMTTFYGTPYIDVRIDFNSWLPKNLKTSTKIKLINFYLKEFKNNKDYHDKVEFDILFTCYTPNAKKRIKNKLKKNFSKKEISDILRELKYITNNLIKNYDQEIKLIQKLKEKQKIIINSNLYPIEKIYWLVEDCKKYGTDPFATLARCAFISVELLNSFVDEMIITNKEKYKFLSTIKSVTSNIINDFKKMSKNKFLKIYGHLRPNTYDILSPNYKDGYSNYFSKVETKSLVSNHFNFSDTQKKKINKFLKTSGLKINFVDLIHFIKTSIEYREYSKFIFTKSVDMIFLNLKTLSRRLDIRLNEFCFLKIQKILELHYNLDNTNLRKVFIDEITSNKKEFNFNKRIKLPEIITSSRDLYVNYEKENKTNFVTTKVVNSDLVFIKDFKEDINGKIVVIENADPGYDYIFNKKIKGLITKYGGVNSHMAIRCAELSVPAAIGVGELIFDKIINKKFITLDCETQKIN